MYEGLIKCMILPPSNLYHPVLPFRNDKGKLLFPLCRKCTEDKTAKTCPHSKTQRALVGTWTSIEIFSALDRGYRILDVFEIWHFPEVSHYSNGDKTLFGGYVDAFIKLKTESSGLPDDCTYQDEFIDEFYKAEGVRFDKLKKNKGMRALCKSILNKNWGKLAQRDNLTKTEYITKPADYFALISDQS